MNKQTDLVKVKYNQSIEVGKGIFEALQPRGRSSAPSVRSSYNLQPGLLRIKGAAIKPGESEQAERG